MKRKLKFEISNITRILNYGEPAKLSKRGKNGDICPYCIPPIRVIGKGFLDGSRGMELKGT